MRRAILLLVLVTAPAGLAAPAPDKAKELPKIVVAVPLAAVAGIPTKIVLRGQKLDRATDVRCSNTAVKVKLLTKGTTDDVAGVGKTQAEIELTIPADFAEPAVIVTLPGAEGESNAHRILVDRLPAVVEKEPNGGFAEAQPIVIGQTVAGAVQRGFDVDVYRFEGKAGQRIRAEVMAARLGSPLDSILTLYSAEGHLLSANDDIDGTTTDSRLDVNLPRDGAYYLVVVDANDHGSPAHVYRLSLQTRP